MGSCPPKDAKEQLPVSDCWPTHTYALGSLVLREARELDVS